MAPWKELRHHGMNAQAILSVTYFGLKDVDHFEARVSPMPLPASSLAQINCDATRLLQNIRI